MKLPIRLENAIKKLYTAFHSGKINAFDCSSCAVGSICNGDEKWVEGIHEFRMTDEYTDISKLPKISNHFNTGYSALEIAEIENIFMFGENLIRSKVYYEDEHDNFKGLCAVVEYLCELDNIPNVMDYTKLFETENNKPKYQLS